MKVTVIYTEPEDSQGEGPSLENRQSQDKLSSAVRTFASSIYMMLA